MPQAFHTPLHVINVEEELHGFFTIQSNIVLDSRVGRYEGALSIMDDLGNVFLLGDIHLSSSLFNRGLGKAYNMPNFLIDLGLLAVVT